MQENHRTIEDPNPHNTVRENTQADVLSWRVHPLVENWIRSGLLLLFYAFILITIYLSFKSIGFTLLAALLLITPIYKYFLPFHYHCGMGSLVVKACCYKIERPWSAFHSHYVDKNGVLLSPFSLPTRLENFRGVYVRFGKHPPKEIIDFIHKKIKTEPQDEPSTSESERNNQNT